MKKLIFTVFMLVSASILTVSCEKDPAPTPTPIAPTTDVVTPETESPSNGLKVKEGFAGIFSAEGKSLDTKFVRVLYLAEGVEKGEGDSMEALVFDSKDKDGKDIKAYRFQIVCKNTGYDKLQKSQEKDPETDKEKEDFKLKQNTGGFKMFVEVPVKEGKMDLNNAVIGNFGYTLVGNDDRKQFTNEDIEQIKFTLKKLDIPAAETSKGKPGNKGVFYELGYISLEFDVKTKTDNIKGVIDSKISLIHVRGKDKLKRKDAGSPVAINPEMVKKNVK